MSETADDALFAGSMPATAGIREPFATADRLTLRTREGCPYADMTFEIPSGQVTAIRGRSGSGKTALLLTLAGRMSSTDGTLTVLGRTMPKQRRVVARNIGMGLFKGVNDLPANATLASATSAEFSLRAKGASSEKVRDYLREWGLSEVAFAYVRDLSADQLAMFGIALACVGDPQAIVVDNIEYGLMEAHRRRIMNCLSDIAHDRGITVVVGCVSRELSDQADHVIVMG
jgi:ABC-type multidrug transport system ATPase subunit